MKPTIGQLAFLAAAWMIALPGGQVMAQPPSEDAAKSPAKRAIVDGAPESDRQPDSKPDGKPAAPEPEPDWIPFDNCGVLVHPYDCLVLDTDLWGLPVLLVLDNYGTFGVGDEVHVVGEIPDICITMCMMVNGCVVDNTIGPCGEPDPCPADVTGDGAVNVADLLAVLAAWGNAGGPEDVNGDGVVDVQDLLEVLAAWGPCGER